MITEGFSTSLMYWDLPRDGRIQIWFADDSDYCLFHYTSVSTTKLGSSQGIQLDSPILELIREKEKKWEFKGIKHNLPTTNNKRDFHWIRFDILLSYLELVEILEKLNTEDDEVQSSASKVKQE